MGCGASKGDAGTANSPTKVAVKGPDKKDEPANVAATKGRAEAVAAFVAPKAALEELRDSSFSSRDGDSIPAKPTTAAAPVGNGSARHRAKADDDEFDYNLPAAGAAGRAGAAPAAGGLLTRNADWLEPEKHEQAVASFSNEEAAPAAPAAGPLFKRPAGDTAAGSLPPLNHNVEMRRRSKVSQSSAGSLHVEPLLPQQQPQPHQGSYAHTPGSHAEQEDEMVQEQQQGQQRHQQQQQLQQWQGRSSSASPLERQPSDQASQAGSSTASSPIPQRPQLDPSDPWSALQSQYQIRGSSPSTTAAPASQRHRQPGAPLGRVTKEELVLEDELDDSSPDGAAATTHKVALRAIPSAESSRTQYSTGASMHHGRSAAPAVAAVAHGTSFRSSEQHSKQGGWGQGQLAAPGTLMLGQQESTKAQPAPIRQKDGVFDDSDDESTGHYGGPSGAAMPGAVFEDGMHEEEVEDVDELLAAQDAKRNALPGDLAAKLARFEAIAGDDDE